MPTEPDLSHRAEQYLAEAYRDGDADGLAHSLAVGRLLAELGCEDHVVAAGLLHDVLEDTPVDVADVRNRFGERTAQLVVALTEDGSIEDYRERKRALREAIAAAGHTALVIFAADKLARMRHADEHGLMIDAAKLEHYLRTRELLAAHGIRTPHVAELDRRLRMHRPSASAR